MLARLAARLLMAPLGFCLGIAAGFAVLALICSQRFATTAMFPDEVALLGYDMTVSAWTIALFLVPLMAAPAIVAVLIAEMFSIRAWAYHAVAGAITAVLPWSLAPAGFDGPIFGAADILAAGFVGGLTHWLAAGRASGLAPPAERSSSPDLRA